MDDLKINSHNYKDYTEKDSNGKPFLVLGEAIPAETDIKRRSAHFRSRRRKIRRGAKAANKFVWGTLGLEGAEGLDWSGELRHSKSGNDHSTPSESMPVTCEQIALIKELHPEAAEGALKVIERYIDLSNINFGELPETFTEKSIPRLRLTLMLEPDEGAVVYLQLYPNKKEIKTSADREEVDLEYVQPEPTPCHNCDERDRLTYHIPLLTDHEYDIDEKKNLIFKSENIYQHFVVKILTFKRKNEGNSQTMLERLRYHLFQHTHELVMWDPALGDFKTIHGSALLPERKTLFLIHGTCSSTRGGFAGLLGGGSQSVVGKLHAANGGPYGQIIGFEHPTFSEDAEMNTLAFQDSLPRGFEFKAGMDLITHSRGGVWGQYLAHHASFCHVQKGALVASANGVGYFTAGQHLAKYLSVLRANTVSPPLIKWILALVEHSGKAFLSRPGSELMTPNHDRLKQAIAPDHLNENVTFLPVVGKYHSSLSQNHRFFRRWGERGLDKVIQFILGGESDWVVGLDQQYLLPKNLYPQKPKPWKPGKPSGNHVYKCLHGGFFVEKNAAGKVDASQRIETFLLKDKAW